MRYLTYIFVIIFFFSCSENGDKYIGNYKSGSKYTLIKKAGDEGYFLTFGERYENEYSIYCIFKNGCFIRKNKNEDVPIICQNGDQLISQEGLIFKKVKFVKN